MWAKYLINIFLNIILINNAFGENKYQSRGEEMPSAWKIELKQMLTDELGMQLNKLQETIEKRFEQNSIVKLEEQLDRKIEEKLNRIIEEKLGKKLETKLEEKLGKKLEDNLGKTLETKLEENIGNKLEVNLGKQLEGNIEEHLEKKFEDKFEKKQNTSQTAEWVSTLLEDAISLSDRAVIAGYEADGSPLWVARIPCDYNLVPGKLNANTLRADSASSLFTRCCIGGHQINTTINVLCAPPERVRWVECRNGVVPPNAVAGGYNQRGDTLYVGRAREQGSLTPGQVTPSDKVLYIIMNENQYSHDIYEVLCLV